MKKLKLFLIVITLFLCLALGGCADINFKIGINANGTIGEEFSVLLDENIISTNGYSKTELKTKIEHDCISEVEKLLDSYYDRVEAALIVNSNYDSDYYYNGIIFLHGWEQNLFKASLSYANLTLYNMFYNITPSTTTDEGEIKIEKLFYTKTSYEMPTVYSDINFSNTLLNYYIENYDLFSVENVNLYYCYAVNSRRWHSDADDVFHINDQYVHSWKLDVNNLDKTINLYKITANKWAWMVAGISAGLLFCSVLIFIAVAKQKKYK